MTFSKGLLLIIVTVSSFGFLQLSAMNQVVSQEDAVPSFCNLDINDLKPEDLLAEIVSLRQVSGFSPEAIAHGLNSWLNSHGLDLCTIQNKYQSTILHRACINGDAASVEIIVHAVGQNLWKLNSVQSLGRSAFDFAVTNGHLAIVDLFVQAAGEKIGDLLSTHSALGRTPLFYAARNGKSDIVTLLINLAKTCNIVAELLKAEEQTGLTPLHAAAIGGHREVCSILLQAAADVGCKEYIINAQDRDNRTALDWANRMLVQIIHVEQDDEHTLYIECLKNTIKILTDLA